MYADLRKRVIEDVVMVPLYTLKGTVGRRADLKGLLYTPPANTCMINFISNRRLLMPGCICTSGQSYLPSIF